MTVCPTVLPCLKSAKFQDLEPDSEVEVNYKSGAIFKGHIEDYKKCGRGLFTWPNGSSYEGEYVENARMGKGIQIWQDSSRYVGDFLNDLRHGQGVLSWANGESYDGTFYKDRRHGTGTYTWPDGSSYTGTFYLDRKEGYGTFRLAGDADSVKSVINGLYKEDHREGPGVLEYTDGKQDVGLWQGEKLMKLCSSFHEAFLMRKHKELDFDPKLHELYIPFEEEKASFLSDMTDPRVLDIFSSVGLSNKVTHFYSDFLDPRSLAVNHQDFDAEFFKSACVKADKDKILAWNKTPAMIKIQRHVLKHQHGQKNIQFEVENVLQGNREGFQSPGQLENASVQLLEAAVTGDTDLVEKLLVAGHVHPDVSDKHGHTALIGATVNWHMDVINCLLNHGADVNRLNDDGCSALSAGIVFFYPHERFRYNVAEHFLEKPKLTIGEQSQTHSCNPTKGILTNGSIGSRIVSQASNNQQILSQRDTGVMDKIVDTKSGQSVASADSGLPQTESGLSQENTPFSQHHVRITDHVNKDTTFQEDDYDDNDSLIDEENGEEFDSNLSLQYYEIKVSEQLIERCATQLSTNERIVGGRRSKDSVSFGTVRHLAVMKFERELMKLTLNLLLRRGADPNASDVPMPVVFFAIKSADVEMVKILLSKGASTNIKLPNKKGGLTPLHFACAIPGEEGIQMTELLLNAGADPNVHATEDDSFLNRTLEEEWSKDIISPESQALLGGRTPLQIACSRDDNCKNICQVVRFLLDHKADPNLLCNGFSPLALAVTSGYDMVVDELLLSGADPSLYLTHGVGSVLCVAMSTEYEHRRSIMGRLHLIDKLVKAGANILMPVPIGPKRLLGTAVDYAYYMFNQDRRIAHMPYHALTHAERETYNARRRLLEHIGDILRIKAVEREKRRIDHESRDGKRSSSPSPSHGFVYIGAGAALPPGAHRPKSLRDQGQVTESHVTFDPKNIQDEAIDRGDLILLPPRKPLFKYCYECGRSVGVRLSPCTRCKEVYYCSKACKMKAWNARHREECIRIGEKSRSPSPVSWRIQHDSPTPATDANREKKTTVASLSKSKNSPKTNSQRRGFSQSAKGRGRGKATEIGKDKRRAKSDTNHRWCPPPGVFVDNYSFV